MSSEARTRPRPSARDRYRYVLFALRAPPQLARGRLLNALRAAEPATGTPTGPWLTRFDGVHGVLRCLRGRELEARRLLGEALRAHGVEAEALLTSGTLAALERRRPELRRHRGPP